MLCPQLTQKLGSSENVGCFSRNACSRCQLGQQAMQHPTSNEDKLIREATGGGEIKAALGSEARNVNKQFPTRELICGSLGTW